MSASTVAQVGATRPNDADPDIPLVDDDLGARPAKQEAAIGDDDLIGRRAKPPAPLPKPEPEEDPEEKARVIAQILELQNTLDDLSQRVDMVKEESLKLRSENQVLGQYIQNLMSASSVFQSTNNAAANKKLSRRS